VGFRAVDRMAETWELGPFLRRGRQRQAEGRRHDQAVLLLKPLTYMNRSGAVVSALRHDPEFDISRDLLIVVDDAALPLGRFRLRGAGSAGGHNGLKSIEGALQRQDYARLRIGVGPVPPGMDGLSDFVLAPFGPEDDAVLDTLWEPLIEAADCWLAEGIERAMTRYNRRPTEET